MEKLQVQISPLSPRDAILDALYRAVLAFDTADFALLESAVMPDATFAMPMQEPIRGLAEVRAKVFDRVSAMNTLHLTTNHRVNIAADGTTAKLTCSTQAAHYRPGEGLKPGAQRFVSLALYDCDMVKDGDLWKMKTWTLNLIAAEGDRGIMTE